MCLSCGLYGIIMSACVVYRTLQHIWGFGNETCISENALWSHNWFYHLSGCRHTSTLVDTAKMFLTVQVHTKGHKATCSYYSTWYIVLVLIIKGRGKLSHRALLEIETCVARFVARAWRRAHTCKRACPCTVRARTGPGPVRASAASYHACSNDFLLTRPIFPSHLCRLP